ERLCREVATRLGLVVAHVFVDNNRSAWQRTRKRPGWDAMLETIRDGGCRHVITYHPDRLMRQPKDLEELLTISDDVGVTLHGQANRRDLSDPDDRFMLRIEVAHACRSSDDTSRRLRDAMVERAQDGIAHTGTRAYGYEPGNMTIREDEAAIVREVFTRYLDGDTTRMIARDLNRRGVPTTREVAWTDSSVRVLLRSRHVAGIRVFRGEDYGRGAWPAIVEEGLWREVQDRMAYRAAAITNRATRFYLLRGLVVCKRCGTTMSGSRNNGTWSYQCARNKRMDQWSCSRRIGALKLEEFVVDAALELLTTLTVSGPQATVSLSEVEQAAISADEAELAELKDMWHARELSTREYRQMRRIVEDRIT
ncbi:MAG: recombinase family protein, partial [Actinobacteria bacterium]|nr:recombinase family protein [Actinomycetota bacterium]